MIHTSVHTPHNTFLNIQDVLIELTQKEKDMTKAIRVQSQTLERIQEQCLTGKQQAKSTLLELESLAISFETAKSTYSQLQVDVRSGEKEKERVKLEIVSCRDRYVLYVCTSICMDVRVCTSVCM